MIEQTLERTEVLIKNRPTIQRRIQNCDKINKANIQHRKL